MAGMRTDQIKRTLAALAVATATTVTVGTATAAQAAAEDDPYAGITRPTCTQLNIEDDVRAVVDCTLAADSGTWEVLVYDVPDPAVWRKQDLLARFVYRTDGGPVATGPVVVALADGTCSQVDLKRVDLEEPVGADVDQVCAPPTTVPAPSGASSVTVTADAPTTTVPTPTTLPSAAPAVSEAPVVAPVPAPAGYVVQTAATGASLPVTGARTAPLAALGALLVGLGGAAVRRGRSMARMA